MNTEVTFLLMGLIFTAVQAAYEPGKLTSPSLTIFTAVQAAYELFKN